VTPDGGRREISAHGQGSDVAVQLFGVLWELATPADLTPEDVSEDVVKSARGA
jgi:hypothetical protein